MSRLDSLIASWQEGVPPANPANLANPATDSPTAPASMRVPPAILTTTATVWQKVAEEACHGLAGYITPGRLLAKLAPEDLTDPQVLRDPLPFLRSFAISLVWTDFRRAGIAPPDWTSVATCDRCGSVYLWAPIHVQGCPWCWNRLHQLPIPRPTATTKPPKGGRQK